MFCVLQQFPYVALRYPRSTRVCRAAGAAALLIVSAIPSALSAHRPATSAYEPHMASLARLTSLSTQTLSLLLERQRLQTLPSNSTSLHAPQIAKNLAQLRSGILELEEKDGPTEASRLLRTQHERMCGMLGPDADSMGVQRCVLIRVFPGRASARELTSFLHPLPFPASRCQERELEPSIASPSPSSSAIPLPPTPPPPTSSTDAAHFAPYTDDPEAGYSSTEMLQQQRQIMDEQDVHLDELSRSIGRQRDISLQINDELDVHTGLLEGLDHDLDRTDSRLTGARRRLDRVARGAKENGACPLSCSGSLANRVFPGSTVMIGLLILVLLILIIVFKT